MKSKILLILAALMLAVLLGACTQSAQEGEANEEEGAETTGDDGFKVEISGFKFNPETITVPVGSTVTWVNLEAAPHSAVGDNGEWDSGGLRKNDSFSFTFETAGTYPYHDYYYPAMSGTVVVTE